MRSRLYAEAVTSGRKTEPGNGSVKAFPDGVTKSLLCVFLGLFRAVFSRICEYTALVACGGSAWIISDTNAGRFQPTGAATESTGNDEGNRVATRAVTVASESAC